MSIRDRAASKAAEIGRNDLLGADEWKNSRLTWLSGLGPAMRAVSLPVGMVTGSVRRVGDMARLAIRRDRVEPLPTSSTDAAERFRVAQHMYQRTEEDIQLDVQSTAKQFTFLFIAATLMAAFAILTFDHNGPMPLLIQLTWRFALVLPVVLMAARMGFYNWQLRTRQLGSVLAWLRQPSEWMASRLPAAGRAMSALLVAGLVGLATMGTAQAESPSAALNAVFKKPDAQDLWLSILQYVFPGIGPLGVNGAMPGGDAGAGGSTAAIAGIQTAFGTYLAILMALGSFFMCYQIILGAVHTAHEGRVLGQRWHTTWAPVRVVLGVGSLAPVTKGFCLSQLLVLQIAIWGGSFGNALWAAYVPAITVNLSGTGPLRPDQAGLFRDMMSLEVCNATMVATANSIAGTTLTPGSRTSFFGPSMTAPPTAWTLAASTAPVRSTFNALTSSVFGWQPFNLSYATLDYGRCGTVTTTFLPAGSATDGLGAARAAFDQTRMDAGIQLITAFRPIAQALVQSVTPGVNGGVQAAPDFTQVLAPIQQYRDRTTQAADTFMNAYSSGTAITTIKQQSASFGWLSSGVFYTTLGRMMEARATVARETFQASVGTGADWNGSLQRYKDALFLANRGTIPVFAQWWSLGLNSSSGGTFDAVAIRNADIAGPTTAESILNKLFPYETMQKWLSGFHIDLSRGNALFDLVDFGHTILNYTFAAVAAMMVVNSVGGWLSGVVSGGLAGAAAGPAGAAAGAVAGGWVTSAIANSIAAISSMIWTIIAMLFAVGVAHAYVLPMVPYFHMFFFALGMLILVVEGAIAAPLWALVHIRMDGGELIDGPQKAGYIIIMNLLLRIPLAMLGLFFSFLVFDVMTWFESATFDAAFFSVTTGHGFALIGLTTAIVMICYLHYQTAMRSFGLITHIPDRVISWMGASPNATGDGEHGSRMAGAMLNVAERKWQVLGGAAQGAGMIRGSRGAITAAPPPGGGGRTGGAAPGRGNRGTEAPSAPPTTEGGARE